MSAYVDSWTEFRQILSNTRKKLLKKPNLPLAISQLNSLSQRMQDDEIPQHAAMCHSEMASLYSRLNNRNEERKQYLLAAKLLMQAYRNHRNSGSRVHCPYPDDICNFYMKAVKIAMDMKELRLAGMTSLEAAKKMNECSCYTMSLDHLQRAVRLLEGEFYMHTEALHLMAEVYLQLDQFEHLLSTVDNLWIAVMKTRAKSSLGRKMLKDCEIITLIVLQKAKLTPAGRHKVLLQMYGQTKALLTDKSPSRVCVKEDSALSPQEFLLFKKLLDSLSSRSHHVSLELLDSEEYKFISPFAQSVCLNVINT